jgi:hypothetical protein
LLGTSLILAGCVPFYVTSTNNPSVSFADKDVLRIEPGRTTKKQILDLFGPPAAIARKGASDQARAAVTSLESFSRPLNDDDIVYYYRSGTAEVNAMGAVPLPDTVTTSRSTQTSELWILIDDRSGVVQDYITKGSTIR